MIAQVYEKLSGHENIWNMHTLDLFQRVDSRFKVTNHSQEQQKKTQHAQHSPPPMCSTESNTSPFYDCA